MSTWTKAAGLPAGTTAHAHQTAPILSSKFFCANPLSYLFRERDIERKRAIESTPPPAPFCLMLLPFGCLSRTEDIDAIHISPACGKCTPHPTQRSPSHNVASSSWPPLPLASFLPPQVSKARLRDDEEEEVAPDPAAKAAAGGPAVTRLGGVAGGGGGGGGGSAAGGANRGAGADGFTVTDAPQEMDANLEYKELALDGDGDDADPDVMMGTQPGGTLKNVAFRVRNR